MSNSPHPRRRTAASRPGERAWIDALRLQTVKSGRTGAVRVGIGDDCAVLRVPSGHEIVVTTDLLLEQVHFRRDWHTPEAAGHRCLARGLSDLAAMGAEPMAAFLSLALPADLSGAWANRFLNGLLALARVHGVPLAGGDTAQAPDAGSGALFSADILLMGAVPAGKALLRSTARAGDRLYVTGALGGAAAELQALAAGTPKRLRALRKAEPGHPHLFPEPRLNVGLRLRKLATAAIDVSDGVATDLDHLCVASGLCAEVNAAAVPVHSLAGRLDDGLHAALTGGEDYELLFTAGAETRVPRQIGGVAVTCIGAMRRTKRGEQAGVLLRAATGEVTPLAVSGWEHFRSRPAR